MKESKERKIRSKSKPIIIGEKYNRWTVTSAPFKKGKTYYVNATCECGTNKDIDKSNLQTLKSNSCGCYAVEVSKNRKGKKNITTKSTEEIAKNLLLLNYKKSAIKRGYSFLLTTEEFSILIGKPCKYCGTRNSNTCNIRGHKDPYLYNGIDRVDNNIGYEINNVVTCCTTCNKMKLTLDIENFFEHMQKIIKNTQVKPGIKESKLESYYQRAITISLNSPDEQTKVGALLISNDSGAVMAEGFNGFVRGAPDYLLPKTRPEKYAYIIHAEENLLCNAVRHCIKTDNCAIFCTLSPCKKCLRTLWQAGIKVIYFKDIYGDLDYSKDMGDLDFDIKIIGNFRKLIFIQE